MRTASTMRSRTRLRALLLVLPVVALIPGGAHAQDTPEPLLKSELIRLIVGDTYSGDEVREIVRRACLTFTPSPEDLTDFRRLGAGEALLDVIAGCGETGTSGGAAEAAIPPAPPDIGSVDSPLGQTRAVLDSALEAPILESVIADPRYRPPAPSYEADEEGLTMLQETAPRLANGEEIQTLLQRAEPTGEAAADGAVRVVLEVYVQQDGSVGDVRIVQGSGRDAYDAAARKVGRAMEFEPATTRGRAHAVWARQVLVFR